jgi:hypothetical protein
MSDDSRTMDDWAEAMKCQPPQVPGPRPLTAGEIHWINRIKAKAEEVRDLLEALAFHTSGLDHRWLSIGKTDLQQGFMAVIRAIERPEGF